MYIAVVRKSDNEVIGVQSSPQLPNDTVAQKFVAVSEALYSQLSDLTYPAGGDFKWIWDGATGFTQNPEVRKTIRVSAVSQIIVSGSNASVTLSVLKSDLTVDTTFNGQIILAVRMGDTVKLFRVQFASGVKSVNIPSTNISQTIEAISSPYSLVETSVPVTIVQDV